ncbi:hypothetical protein QR98_0088570 [Sarcoptes scabiei]|uniref:Uncharacterized protein n=1 Tax=Sarcoptes scabiei TaxID=52283 RepID=A0A132AH40_SARSC|nr:hypothetical protein QR98_0088570 [Sarcoptes scabiei]
MFIKLKIFNNKLVRNSSKYRKLLNKLIDFKKRQVTAFKKYLVELTDLEIKHAKSQVQLLRKCLSSLNEENSN